eukprot:TRINITY_DN2281_c0_g1_i3.p1 TRINITY_DN2281_c0_g1~~TRINITY_DN2281_c0_g1_i3.p1  ORF type:complete len:695 (+),score=180.38 TRINITY_DN2281_c0_g1_i3:148-2232(+)
MWSDMQMRWADMEIWQAQPIGRANGTIFGDRGTNLTLGFEGCRWGDCPMGRVINQVMLWWCKDCDIAVWNSGNIRASWTSGNVTLRNALSVLPFGNVASYFKIKGSTFINALVNSISKGGGQGRFLQPYNIRYAWNPDINIPASKRLVRVEFFDRSRQAWIALDPQRTFKVVTNNFLRTGGDDYSMFVTSVTEPFDWGPIDITVVTDYLLANPIVSAPTREALQICYQWADPNKGMWPKNTWPMAGGDAGPCLIVPTAVTGDSDFGCPNNAPLCRSIFNNGGMLFSSQYVTNISQCARECSGLGSCLEAQCQCAAPSAGMFKGMSMIQGADCSTFRTVLDVSDGSRITVYVVSGIATTVILCVAIALIIYQNVPIIRATTPKFGLLTCMGALMGVASVLLVVQPPTDATCAAALWLTSTAYIILFASVFVRVYRIDRIFNNNSNMEVIRIPDTELGAMILFMLLVDVGLLTYWQVTSPYAAKGVLSSSDFSAIVTCSSEQGTFLTILLLFYHGMLMLWGMSLAYKTRHVEKNFNESRFIGLALYNLFFISIFAIPVIFAVGTSQHELGILVRCFATLYIVAFTVLVLFANRFYAIYKGQGHFHTQPTARTTTQHTSHAPENTVSMHEYDKLQKEHEKLLKEVHELRDENARLKQEADARTRSRHDIPAAARSIKLPPAIQLTPRISENSSENQV